MYGDFSRLTFAPEKRFSAVLIPQGRPLVEADANENTATLLRYLRMLATDLIGPHGGPLGAAGFGISAAQRGGRLADLNLGPGRYYVDGLLVENPGQDERGDPLAVTYYGQPDAYFDPERADDRLPDDFPFVVYLKTWEHLVTHLQDPSTRDVALGANGPDSAVRTKVVWQVLTADRQSNGDSFPHDVSRGDVENDWPELMKLFRPEPRARLRARARRGQAAEADVCIVSPEARYRGPENQLYRVEIHRGGSLADGDEPTFKWSRENGSVAFAIESLVGDRVVLTHLGRDRRLGLQVGDLVEIVDDAYALRGRPEPLRRIVAIDRLEPAVTLDQAPEGAVGQNAALHPLLRRWDQRAGERPRGGLTLDDSHTALISESAAADTGWLALEDGLEVQFQPDSAYRSGDYWLIPARTETGDVEWPRGPGDLPLPRESHGIEDHFAPLAIVRDLDDVVDLRCLFNRQACPLPD